MTSNVLFFRRVSLSLTRLYLGRPRVDFSSFAFRHEMFMVSLRTYLTPFRSLCVFCFLCYFFSVKGAQNESPWILTVNSKRSGLKVSLFQPRGLFELYSYFHALFHQPRKRIASGCYDFSIDWILNKQQSMEKSGRFSCFWVKHITLNRRGMDFWCNMKIWIKMCCVRHKMKNGKPRNCQFIHKCSINIVGN